HAERQPARDQPNPDRMPANAGLAKRTRRINPDALESASNSTGHSDGRKARPYPRSTARGSGSVTLLVYMHKGCTRDVHRGGSQAVPYRQASGNRAQPGVGDGASGGGPRPSFGEEVML